MFATGYAIELGYPALAIKGRRGGESIHRDAALQQR